LATLVASLVACEDSFMICNQEDTPALRNYGEVLLCKYTKSYVFSFPAMATAVLLLICGRDFVQKRFYYGMLKAGGVISFSMNTAWKDLFFMTVCWDFCHCFGYTVFHMIILSRMGQEASMMRGFVPEVSSNSTMPTNGEGSTTVVTTLTTTLAVTGAMMLFNGGPKGGFKVHGPHAKGAKGAASSSGTTLMLHKYIKTLMVLIATFLETLLLIIFMYWAYDITGTLVSLSEYLDSYEDRKGNSWVRLHSFRDTVAKRILEQIPQIISSAERDLHRVYARIVLHTRLNSMQHSPPGPEGGPLDTEEPVVGVGINSKKSASIGLLRSLWPAELLMRRDIQGQDCKNFRRAWIVYAVFAICWMFQIAFVLVMQATQEVERVLNKEFEHLITLSILILHTAGVCMTMYVFWQSLEPLVPDVQQWPEWCPCVSGAQEGKTWRSRMLFPPCSSCSEGLTLGRTD